MVALARPGRADGPRRSGTPTRAARRPEPAPHERYLWDTGFHWGEWLVPGRGRSATSGRSWPRTRATSRRRTSPTAPRLMARIADGARPDRRRRPVRRAQRARPGRLAGRVPRRRRPADAGHAGQPRARAGVRPGARRAAAGGRRPAGRADPQGRHPPRHRLPRHALPAAGARRHRPPRRRLRAAARRTPSRPGWSWSTAARPRCGSAGTASTPTACRTSRSTTTPRARSSRSCTGTPPGIELRRARVPALPRPARGPAAG